MFCLLNCKKTISKTEVNSTIIKDTVSANTPDIEPQHNAVSPAITTPKSSSKANTNSLKKTPAIESKQQPKQQLSAAKERVVKNSSRVLKKKNIIEISQSFNATNETNYAIGTPVVIDLSNTSGAALSAYCLHKTDYNISFRVFENGSWSIWQELPENKNVNNPNRKVFSPKNLTNSVTQLQFKSNKTIPNDVVFRLYTFKKK